MVRRLSTPQLVFDVVVASLCVLLRAILPFDSAAGWVMLLAMGAALAIRRLSPGVALAVAWVGAISQMAGMLPPDAANLAILAVLFSTARHGEPLVRWLGLASAFVGAVLATAYLVLLNFTAVDLGSGNSAFIALPQYALQIVLGFSACIAVLGLSWTLGLLVRTWANARESRAREARAERTVVVEQERNRIARDMHDVVAHSLAVVIAQADGGRYAGATDPAAADAALATIASTAREALADVRMLLGQLRHNQEQGPQPVLADLGALVNGMQASGLDVSFSEQGSAPPLPASQQLAIYRIVQEALTNALRHGDAAGRVDATLDWSTDAASLTISNLLRQGAAVDPKPGHGLTGMRERALLVGGSLAAAPDGDRFVVTARIPVPVTA